MIMDSIILVTLVSFFITFIAIPVVIRVADAKKLFDLPGERKVHFTPIPSLGGIGIFASVVFAVTTLVSFSTTPALQFFIAASIIIFFLGMKDDILLISPMKKFTGQFLATFLLAYQKDFQLTSFHGFLGIYDLHPAISILFTYMTILVIINAFNLIDGVDGLAGTLGLFSTLFFGVVFAIEKDYSYAILSFSMAASLVAFLLYNYSPARIFMGDTGSLMLGLVNAVLVIRFINTESMTSSTLDFQSAAAIGFAALFIPLMDTLRVIVIRVYFGRSPFDPDVNHIHHILLRRGLSHLQITGLLTLASAFFLGFALAFDSLGINFIILSLFGMGTATAAYLKWFAPGAEKFSLQSRYRTKATQETAENY